MSVMLFDLANDQPGHVAGAQGELESRLGPVLGEGAGPRARVRGWQEGLWTQVGFFYHLFCKTLFCFKPEIVSCHRLSSNHSILLF